MDLRRAAVVLAASSLGLAACGPASPTSSGPLSPSAASERALPTSYEYVLTSTCGERGLLGDYRVVVRDDQVTEVVGLDETYPYEPGPDEVPTLADLLEMAGSAETDAVVDLRVDPDGVPVSLSIDHVPTAVDDEECYAVSELQVTTP